MLVNCVLASEVRAALEGESFRDCLCPEQVHLQQKLGCPVYPERRQQVPWGVTGEELMCLYRQVHGLNSP